MSAEKKMSEKPLVQCCTCSDCRESENPIHLFDWRSYKGQWYEYLTTDGLKHVNSWVDDLCELIEDEDTLFKGDQGEHKIFHSKDVVKNPQDGGSGSGHWRDYRERAIKKKRARKNR